MKNLKKICLASILFFLLCFSGMTRVSADSNEEVGFNIEAIIPENQIDKKNSFFDLKMLPEQEQTILVRINNTSNEKSDYEINVNQAYTNDQGFIDYNDSNKSTAINAPVKIGDIVTYDQSVNVEAKSSKEVKFVIKMPKESFDGQILAGIQVLKKNKDSNNSSEINNSYGYILGLKLSETDTSIKRELELTDIVPEAKFGKPTVIATLNNPTMDAYGHLVYDVKITKESDGEEILSRKYDNDMQLAPNSNYLFAIEFDDQALIAGDYILNLTVSDSKDNKWNFKEKFTISSKQANDINNVTVNQGIETSSFPYEIFFIGVAIGVVILIVVFIFIKKKQKEKHKIRANQNNKFKVKKKNRINKKDN